MRKKFISVLLATILTLMFLTPAMASYVPDQILDEYSMDASVTSSSIFDDICITGLKADMLSHPALMELYEAAAIAPIGSIENSVTIEMVVALNATVIYNTKGTYDNKVTNSNSGVIVAGTTDGYKVMEGLNTGLKEWIV